MSGFISKHFWPVDQMKDCSVGSAVQRMKAYEYNQKRIGVLTGPIFNLFAGMLASYFSLIIFEPVSKVTVGYLYLVVLFGVSMTVCLVGSLVLSIAYVFLKNSDG
jgi:hypothetical protein